MINVSLQPRTIQDYDVFKMETAAHGGQSQPLRSRQQGAAQVTDEGLASRDERVHETKISNK